MIVSIHQPAYLPWLGYFHKICLSDVFVYLDMTQFEKNSFINRNKIKTSNGPAWLTVPVKLKDHFQREIRDIEIADQKWSEKHWKSIEMNYKKSKYWHNYAEELKKIYENKYDNISDLCWDQLVLFVKLLGIETEIKKSSELSEFDSKKLQLVLDICKETKADIYISGKLGRDYIDEKSFNESGIKLYYQDYDYPSYNQLWSNDFIPYLSIIDLLFNEGPDSLDIIIKNNMTKQALLKKIYE